MLTAFSPDTASLQQSGGLRCANPSYGRAPEGIDHRIRMMVRPLRTLILVVSIISNLYSVTANGGARGPGIDQQPMYGGMDRSAYPELEAADKEFISAVTNEFGSREAASDRFVEQGVRFYRQDDYSMAMKRFNQAWLLNPKNPEAFWGFAVVYHDEGKVCEAKDMVDRALDLNLTKPIALADGGRIYTLCAVSDKTLTQATKGQYFEKSEKLYKKAETAAPNHDYILGSWASALYWRGEYARSWEMVAKARRMGFVFPGKFLDLLRDKMPEPKY